MIAFSLNQGQVLMTLMSVLLVFVILRLALQFVGWQGARPVGVAGSSAPSGQTGTVAAEEAGSSAPGARNGSEEPVRVAGRSAPAGESEDSARGSGLRSRTSTASRRGGIITEELVRRGRVRAILSTFTVPELKDCCRLYRLRVGGNKGMLIDRLMATGKLLTEPQAKELEDLRASHYRRGLVWPKLELRQLFSPEEAERTLEVLRIACRSGER